MLPASVSNALIVAGVSLITNGLFYYLVDRRERLRDATLARLHARIDDMERDTIVSIGKRIDHESDCRKEIYGRMDHDLVKYRDCVAVQASLRDRLESGDKLMTGLSAQIRELLSQGAATASQLSIIVDRMNVTIGEGP